jgi:hypothetical protein
VESPLGRAPHHHAAVFLTPCANARR